jgi:predicted dehydrogenase
MINVPYQKAEPRIGMIGTGGRGTNLLENLLGADAKVLALCDIVREKAEHAQSLVTKAGQPSPELYTDGEHAFEKLVARDDLDLVIIATPWQWHVEMAVAAMKHGKHTCTEVPATHSIEDCWRLVDTSEETRRAVRRPALRRRRVPARSARGAVLQQGRGPVAARLPYPVQRQYLSHPRTGPGGQLHAHQSRGSL